MNQDIHRLVYYSHNRTGRLAEDMASTIERILAASRRNNARLSVTGALMFNGGCFGQVLEGPRSAVEHIFENIQQDERHGDVHVLAFSEAPERAFDGWSMGFVGEGKMNAQQYARVADDSGYVPSRMTGDALFETLHRLVKEEEQSVGSVISGY